MSVNITSTHPLMTKKQFLVSSRKEAMVVRDSLKIVVIFCDFTGSLFV